MRNLLDKINKKEDEGWEGSKRRCVLFREIARAIAADKDTNG